jgi:hypothetical protein
LENLRVGIQLLALYIAAIHLGEKTMKLIGLSCALIVVLSIVTGCATKKEKETKKAEKEAYMEDGSMDEQVQSWKKHGRYKSGM